MERRWTRINHNNLRHGFRSITVDCAHEHHIHKENFFKISLKEKNIYRGVCRSDELISKNENMTSYCHTSDEIYRSMPNNLHECK